MRARSSHSIRATLAPPAMMLCTSCLSFPGSQPRLEYLQRQYPTSSLEHPSPPSQQQTHAPRALFYQDQLTPFHQPRCETTTLRHHDANQCNVYVGRARGDCAASHASTPTQGMASSTIIRQQHPKMTIAYLAGHVNKTGNTNNKLSTTSHHLISSFINIHADSAHPKVHSWQSSDHDSVVRTPRSPRPSYNELEKFTITYYRIIKRWTWDYIDIKFSQVFKQRGSGNKRGLMYVYYRVRKEWSMPMVRKNNHDHTVGRHIVLAKAEDLSLPYLVNLGISDRESIETELRSYRQSLAKRETRHQLR